MISVAETRRFILSSCQATEPANVALRHASGKVLAQTIRAIHPVPPFDNSAMDGYAVRSRDTAHAPVQLRVVGRLMAGENQHHTVSQGEAVRIMTGALLPEGADAVCPIEAVRLDATGAILGIETPVQRGLFVRRAGDDIRSGAEVFKPHTFLRPTHVGVLSSIGIETLLVYPTPKVGVLSTGDELVTTGSLTAAKIRDANRPALLAQLEEDGFDPVDLGTSPDDESILASLINEAGKACDAVITSGGVSIGDRDVVSSVFKELSGKTMRSMQVAIKPAKPLAFGVLKSQKIPLFGLPGNPVSALVSYELFVRPALRCIAGYSELDRPRLVGVAETDIRRSQDGKLHLIRAKTWTGVDGVLRVRPCGVQASHILSGMAESNGLALVPNGDGVRSGDRVEILLLDAQTLTTSREESW